MKRCYTHFFGLRAPGTGCFDKQLKKNGIQPVLGLGVSLLKPPKKLVRR